MRPCRLDRAERNQPKARTCNCGLAESENPEDADLIRLFQDLELTLLDLMDPDDADILARFELRGETLSEIATQLRCSQAEASCRLIHAQGHFCQLVVLALAPAKP
jgi:hypothetical protein